MNAFLTRVSAVAEEDLRCEDLSIIQVNVGLKCNQQCAHCHVEAGPDRTELMDWPTMELVIEACRQARPRSVDLTGGAPEMNPNLERFIRALRADGMTVQCRTNLTVLLEPDMEALPVLFKECGVRLVASMPCYLEENVRAQRGAGVYERSIEAIRLLNAAGYGVDPELQLNLVYNPGGPDLPPAQDDLEGDYRQELRENFGIEFTNLLTIANMPLGRFQAMLKRENREEEYMRLLVDSFNAGTIDGLMCRHQISIGWDGTLYDCDFHLAEAVPLDEGGPRHVKDFNVAQIAQRRIVTRDYCFGCTAGSGSSCGGALTT